MRRYEIGGPLSHKSIQIQPVLIQALMIFIAILDTDHKVVFDSES